MALQDTATLSTYINSFIKTNGTKAITGAIMNTALINIIDSMYNKSSDSHLVGLKPHDAAKIYNTGDTVIYQNDIYQANTDALTGAFNPANWTKLVDAAGDLPEFIDDQVAALIQNGTGLTWTYDDGAGTLTGNVGGLTITEFASTNISQWTNDAGYLVNIVEDTTPQLGGALDVNGNNITSGGSNAIEFDVLQNITIPNGNLTLSGGDIQQTTTDTNYFKGSIGVGAVDNVASLAGNGLYITGDNATTAHIKIDSASQQNAFLTLNHNSTGGTGARNSFVQYQVDGITGYMMGINGQDNDATDGLFIITNGDSFDDDGVIVMKPNGNVGIGLGNSGEPSANLLEIGPASLTNASLKIREQSGTPSSPESGMIRNDAGTPYWYDGTSWVDLSATGAGIANVVDDTTPQLGGALDVNGQKIVSVAGGNIDIEPNGTGNVLLGNFTFDADQTVGAGQDNYVLTYDNATGLISLEAAAGGGGGLTIGDAITGGTASRILLEDSSNNLWENDHLKFIYSGTAPNDSMALVVEGYGIKSDTIQAINHPFPTTYYTKIGNSGKIEGAHNGTKWSMESDGTYNYYRSVTAHPCIFQTSNGTYTQLWLDANSNKVKIGAFVAPSATLDVRGAGTTSGTSALKVENSGSTTTLEAKDNGEVSLGNYTFDSSAAVGVGQDNYVLTYDNATGKIGLEAAAGGSSPWSELTTPNRLFYSDIVTIGDDNNTWLGTPTDGLLIFGGLNTIDAVQRGAIFGSSNTVGTVATAAAPFISGNSNIVYGGTANTLFGTSNRTGYGDQNFGAGNLNYAYGNRNIALGDSNQIGTTTVNRNDCVTIGDSCFAYGGDHQIMIGKGIQTNTSWATAKGIYFGIDSGRANAGFFKDPLAGPNWPTNFILGNRSAMRTDSTGGIQNGTGGGIWYLYNEPSDTNIQEPTVDLGNATAMWSKDRVAGVSGLLVKAENGSKSWIGDRIGVNVTSSGVATASLTTTIDASMHVFGEGSTSATSGIKHENSSGTVTFETRDDGVIIASNLPTSSAGLPTGALWNNSGVINIV